MLEFTEVLSRSRIPTPRAHDMSPLSTTESIHICRHQIDGLGIGVVRISGNINGEVPSGRHILLWPFCGGG